MRSRSAILLPLLLAALALVSGCQGEQSPGAGRATARLVVPEAQSAGAGPAGAPPAAPSSASSPAPKVALGANEKAIAVMDVNLNLDRTDEQILITQGIDSTDEPIRIAVVEYDAVYQAYRRSWEDVTSATDERYFTVSTLDLVGDHSLEIVCQGATLDNKLTMDVYRRSVAAGSTKLSYSSIFSAVAAGDIDIEEQPRSQAYLSGDADGRPFAITVSEPDTGSPDGVDIVKTTYQWNTRDRRYVATATSRIKGEIVEREQLQALFASSSPEQYIQFLAGSWIRSTAGSQNDGSSIGELIRFLPHDRTMQILSSQNRVQEEYTWDKSDCYYGNLMLRGARNTILPDITRNVRVSVQSLQQVLVTVESTIDANDFWKATYRRVSEQALTRELAEPRRPDPVVQPAGLYEGKDGDQLIFQAPRFSWVRGNTTLAGGFYLYRLDRLVLGLLVDKGYGGRPEERAYIASQSSRVEAKRTLLTLTLQPAELTVYGARPVSEEVLTFTQVQTPAAGQ